MKSLAFLQKIIFGSQTKLLLLISLVSPTSAFAVKVGEPAPFFELPSVENSAHRLEDYKSKVVLVNFWASWCSPCRKELPLLDKLQAKHDDLVVIAINIDSEKENALQFLRQYKVKSLVLFDLLTEVVAQYGAMAMPTSYILDKQGVIRYLHYGFNADKDPIKWESEIAALLD